MFEIQPNISRPDFPMFFPVELNFARNQIICPVSFGLLSPYKKYTFEICLEFVFTFDILEFKFWNLGFSLEESRNIFVS